MFKKLTSCLLFASLLITLCACNSSGDTSVDTKPSDSVADTTPLLPAGIERKNYSDAEVNIVYPDWGLYRNYFHSETNTGEVIDVALFNRELKVEEYLGVTINHTPVDTHTKLYHTVRDIAVTGDDVYQIALAHCIEGVSNMATEGMLWDLSEISTIDPTTEWWNTRSMENLSMNGHMYYAVNDYMIPDPNAVIFNREFIDIYKLDDPYDIVKSGNWTIDTMLSMMKSVTKDNGDAVWDINDTYGFGCPNDWFLTSFIYSSDLLLLDKDEDGLYTVAFTMNDRTSKFAEKLETLLNGPDTYLYNYNDDYTGDPTKSLNLKNGRTLFGLVALNELHNYRETTVDYGLLPYPKLDAEQEDYISLDWSGLLCVPSSVEEPEMVGEVIELLAYYSKDEVLPAYYELVLGEKLSRDEESKAMLDIIFDGVVYDAGMNYFGYKSKSIGKYWDIGDQISGGAWSGLASFIATYETQAQAEVEAFNEAILDLE